METTTNAENETVVVLRKTARQLARSAPELAEGINRVANAIEKAPGADAFAWASAFADTTRGPKMSKALYNLSEQLDRIEGEPHLNASAELAFLGLTVECPDSSPLIFGNQAVAPDVEEGETLIVCLDPSDDGIYHAFSLDDGEGGTADEETHIERAEEIASHGMARTMVFQLVAKFGFDDDDDGLDDDGLDDDGLDDDDDGLDDDGLDGDPVT